MEQLRQVSKSIKQRGVGTSGSTVAAMVTKSTLHRRCHNPLTPVVFLVGLATPATGPNAPTPELWSSAKKVPQVASSRSVVETAKSNRSTRDASSERRVKITKRKIMFHLKIRRTISADLTRTRAPPYADSAAIRTIATTCLTLSIWMVGDKNSTKLTNHKWSNWPQVLPIRKIMPPCSTRAVRMFKTDKCWKINPSYKEEENVKNVQ